MHQVTISRTQTEAIIQPKEDSIATTNLALGPEVSLMSDEEILAAYNRSVEAMRLMAAEYNHVAVEIPIGSRQVDYDADCDQWIPRGHVIRCLIDDGGPDAEATVVIDDREFSMHEFGRMLTTFAGWGMRLVIVPEDEIETTPTIETREPD